MRIERVDNSSAKLSGLPAWRYVILPHSDVVAGKFRKAEYAMDLAQLTVGRGEKEYTDAVEFFTRTYLTDGMRRLLTQALRQLTSGNGEPVILLETGFGGGKTHSLLALYHMFSGQADIDKLSNVQSVLERCGMKSPTKANVAVLVGTALDPAQSKPVSGYSEYIVHTLWGEMAAQLALQAGDIRLYELIQAADAAGVSPGSVTLTELLDACGPCLILMDEILAYAKKLYGASGLPAGSFDNFLTFMQELTEAVKASKNSMLVVTLPETEMEVGSTAGRIVWQQLKQILGRIEVGWQPVSTHEIVQIVRQRLFANVQDTAAMEMVCNAFSTMYNEYAAVFPSICKELEYHERMKQCYPVHPDMFDQLLEWSALDSFQGIRGILRLLAAVVYEYWQSNDTSLLIMPGTLNLISPMVREELTRYLSEGWNLVIDQDIAGQNSVAYELDAHNPRFGKYQAASRVARTILLGSAFLGQDRYIQAIELQRLRLNTVQPGESYTVFDDALVHLQQESTYLYSDAANQHFWYATKPTLRKLAADRGHQISVAQIEDEIVRRIHDFNNLGEFAAVHHCPAASAAVPDEPRVRLVVLAPKYPHQKDNLQSKAIQEAEIILSNHGAVPRIHRNMLVFIAADQAALSSLAAEVRKYLAWQSLVADAHNLQLDAVQLQEVSFNLQRCSETVELQLKETYCWLLIPIQDGAEPLTWEQIKLVGGSDPCLVSKKMVQLEQLITSWSPALLKMELDRWLWSDQPHVQIQRLWHYFSSYCYLPRLRDIHVLLNTISQGLSSESYFAYASGIDASSGYLDLTLGDAKKVKLDLNGYLVKLEAANAQLEKFAGESNNTPFAETALDISLPCQPTKFSAAAIVDIDRFSHHAQIIAEEIIQHFSQIPGARIKIKLEIEAEVATGIPEYVQKIVKENCIALKFNNFSFDD